MGNVSDASTTRMPLSKPMGHGGSSCIETMPPLSKAKSACDAAGAERIPRWGSPILVCLPSAWVRVSVPLLFSGSKWRPAISIVRGTSLADSRL